MFGFDRLTLGAGAIAGAAVTWLAFTSLNAAVWLPAAEDRGRLEERQAQAERAADLIQQMETDNADLREMSAGDRCRELLRGSGLPVDACD